MAGPYSSTLAKLMKSIPTYSSSQPHFPGSQPPAPSYVPSYPAQSLSYHAAADDSGQLDHHQVPGFAEDVGQGF